MKNKKSKDKNVVSKKKKGLLFRTIAKIMNCYYKKYKLIGVENIPNEPSLIIGNHAQSYGPFAMQLKFPYDKKIWCIGNMMHIKETPSYAFKDFWGYKPKWTHWYYRILSYLIAPLCVYIFRNADTIGVYKDMRGLSTFKNSVKALNENNNIIIFPEYHTKFNEIVNDFQDKFIDLARLYYKDTRKELSFVPMYIAPKLKNIVFGKAIKFDSTKSIEDQRKIICDYLKTEITKLAKDLPVHTVVPYANISKKKYPKSK